MASSLAGCGGSLLLKAFNKLACFIDLVYYLVVVARCDYRKVTMEKFKCEIELGNDAMQSNEQIARALLDVADALLSTDIGNIRDENGNTVGSWEVK